MCTIKDKTLRFSSDLYYKTDKSLVFDNTKIKCLTISYSPCSFMVSLQGGTETYLELKNGSSLTGKQIVIAAGESEVIIGEDSTLFASGQSIVMAGSQPRGLGAAFIGEAGYCGGIKGFEKTMMLTYGQFQRMPASTDITSYDDEIGSIGKPNDVETAGGGRIVIYADAVTFKGEGPKIQANARPYSDWKPRKYSLQGGSAGYIYVRTLNTVKQNSISDNSRIEA